MAVRRAKIKEQMEGTVRPYLEPGEQIVAEGMTLKGPNPWLVSGLLGLIGWMFMAYYYLVVTDRRVLYVRASTWTQRPKAVEAAEPRGSVAITSDEPKAVWSRMQLRRADGTEWKLWYHRIWREDVAGVVRALQGQAVDQQPAQTAYPQQGFVQPGYPQQQPGQAPPQVFPPPPPGAAGGGFTG
jgi:hypothetical protein